MAAHKAALEARSVAALSRSGYPEPYRARVLPREKRRLGDAFGLTRIGINLTTLPPGKESSMRHWHTREEEFLYVLEGEVVLRTGAGEQRLTAGMCAGFPAGLEDGHQLINRSDRPAVYLEVGNRDPEDTAYYPDPEVDLVHSPPHARGRFTRRDGTPYE
ncbi:MAG TPA: cupin domain-containing protein [Steroidobacteraceae bacterium]|nr:cupin domain-containing protein [Steroidobacteraceae bacterium]